MIGGDGERVAGNNIPKRKISCYQIATHDYAITHGLNFSKAMNLHLRSRWESGTAIIFAM
jgi:hypothetical protein